MTTRIYVDPAHSGAMTAAARDAAQAYVRTWAQEYPELGITYDSLPSAILGDRLALLLSRDLSRWEHDTGQSRGTWHVRRVQVYAAGAHVADLVRVDHAGEPPFYLLHAAPWIVRKYGVDPAQYVQGRADYQNTLWRMRAVPAVVEAGAGFWSDEVQPGEYRRGQ